MTASPDSPPRWVAYQSDVTGRYEVYIQAFPEPRGKFQISTGGGQYPQWGAGGHELFYVSPDNKLMVAEVNAPATTFAVGTVRALFEVSPRLTAFAGSNAYSSRPIPGLCAP